MMNSIDRWINGCARLTRPDRVVLCDGSDREFEILTQEMLDERTLIRLNPASHPGSFLYRSRPDDVARTEDVTFICSAKKEDAGPTNNWMDPAAASADARALLAGAMRGRTMYVVPVSLGPVGSRLSRVGIELTDSPYVVLNMHLLNRGRFISLEEASESPHPPMFGIHSLGDSSRKFIPHFPEENLVISIGSGYGGNALLGKKCFGLRLASCLGRAEGWLSEHMMVLGLETPEGETIYIAGAFPSACGKTNLAMLESRLPGYRVWTVSDDLAFLHPGSDGRLWAVNPEAGFFAVAAGTGRATNPNMLDTIGKGTIFTNVAYDPATRKPWWEGIGYPPPSGLLDWKGAPWNPESGPASHPNARFTVPAEQCPSISGKLNAPKGVPLSAIIFGGRRTRAVPLIYEAHSWQHGMFLGFSMASETTAAATGKTGLLRRDPFAMLPFSGYNMADSVAHRLAVGAKLTNPPKVFHLNLFRKDTEGKFLWKGFGENIQLLRWIDSRIQGTAGAAESRAGLVPVPGDIRYLDGSAPQEELFSANRGEWLSEADATEEYFSQFGSRLPPEMREELERLKARVK